MIRFNNDYNRGAFDSVLKGLAAANSVSYQGYGEDEWSRRAEGVIKRLIASDDALIKFIPGGYTGKYCYNRSGAVAYTKRYRSRYRAHKLPRGSVG